MAKKYSTTFAATEDPLSESGAWQTRINTILTDMKSSSTTGRASAKALGIAAYDDSAALLAGYGNDYELTCTVFKDPTINTSAGHENELLLRASQTTTLSTQYECLFSFNGNVQCFRWFNNGGAQDFELQTALLGGESIGREFVTGDRIRARMSGSIITMTAIDGSAVKTLLGVYNNTVLSTGQPGIGGFIRSLDGADALKYCFNDAQISDIFAISQTATDDCARSNETPLSKSGAWVSASDMLALDLVSNRILAHTANNDSGMRYTGVTAETDHYAEITIGTVGGGDFGAAVCMQASGDCYLTTNFNASSLFIFERIGGSFNQIANPAGTYAANDVIRLERFGSYIRIYQNGTLIDTVSANVTLLGGTFGIFMYDGTSRISAFAGGNIAATYDAVPGSGGTTTTSTLTDNTTITDQLLSSVARGRNSADSYIFADGFISSATRGQTQGDVLTMADFSATAMLRGVIATDPIEMTDELRYFLIRNRLLEDTTVFTDGFISSLTNSQIITLIVTSLSVFSDQGFLYLLRNLSADDLLTIVDEARLSLIRNRLLEDTTVFTDGFISALTASQITTLIATSLTVFTDENLVFLLRNLSTSDLLTMADSSIASVERNAFSSDLIDVADSGISYRQFNRGLDSAIDLFDNQFNFKFLTRLIESTLVTTDPYISNFIDGEASLVDGSNIRTGFARQPISIGCSNLVRIH